MADDLGGLASVLGERLDVRDEVVRQGERMKQLATREEMNAADMRTEQAVSGIIDRSGASLREYVRDRVNEGGLKTESTLKDLEKHLKEHIASATSTAVAMAVAPMLAQLQALATVAQVPPAAPTVGQDRRLHPAGVGVGALSGASILYLVLAFLNIVPRP